MDNEQDLLFHEFRERVVYRLLTEGKKLTVDIRPCFDKGYTVAGTLRWLLNRKEVMEAVI